MEDFSSSYIKMIRTLLQSKGPVSSNPKYSLIFRHFPQQNSLLIYFNVIMYLKLLPPFILIITGTSTSRRVSSILFLLLSFGLSPRIGLLLDLLLPVFLTLGTFCSLRECKVLVCLAALILLARGFFFFF